jgi:hypothetical protein
MSISTSNKVKQSSYATLSSSNITSNIGNNNIGRVVGIILDKMSPGIDDPRLNGIADIGAIFYTQYSPGKEDITKIPEARDEYIKFLKSPKVFVAKPIATNIKEFPLLGELVVLNDGPNTLFGTVKEAQNSQIKYYNPTPISVWNSINSNNEFNNQSITSGKYFTPSSISSLLPFEGDQLIEGRSGNSIRFSSSYPLANNWWNRATNNGDPITIISNGQEKTKSIEPIIEDLTKDESHIILTSTQQIPLKTFNYTPNPLTSTPTPERYSDSQVMLDANKVVLNAKKDDIILYSNNNTEVYSNNYITLNSPEAISLNSRFILLGQNSNTNQYPVESAILGCKLETILVSIISSIQRLSTDLIAIKSSSEYDVNMASQFNAVGQQLQTINDSLNLLIVPKTTPLSNTVYIKDNI